MKTKQQLRDELAAVLGDEIERLALDNIDGKQKTQCDIVSLANATINHLTPVMDEVVEALETCQSDSYDMWFDEDAVKAAMTKLSCWRNV